MFAAKIQKQSFLGIALITSTIALGLPTSVKAQSEDISAILVQTADMMNANLPTMIDEDIQWDSSVAGPGKILSYNYTVFNYDSTVIDTEQFSDNIHGFLVDTVCTTPATQIFPKNGVLLNFNYYDSEHELISKVQVPPSDCGY